MPLPPSSNPFHVLVVEEINNPSPAQPDITATPTKNTTAPPASASAPPRRAFRPRWECRLPDKLQISTTEPGPNALYLRVETESTETQRKQGVRALLDCGATGLFIDSEYVKSNRIPTRKLSSPIPVFNVDGSPNQDGAITEVADLVLCYNCHSERALFAVTKLGRQNLILGFTWLRDHNPEVN